jgi:multimeric flavodoxin WrbA
MRRRIIVLKGSPREKGNSATLAEHLVKGAREAGAEVESFYLHGMDIQACDACYTCQGVAGLDCIVEDDMQILYPKLWEADAVVYASPVYWFSVSAQLKLAIDRCFGMGGDTDDFANHALVGKQIGVILTYGDDDPFDSGAVNALRMFQDIFRYIPAEIVGMVYGQAGSSGGMESNHELMDRAFELGRKLATEG